MKNRSMMIIAAAATVAVVAYADATRSTVDARLAESIHDIKKCGAGSWRGVFDWKAYDAVDWSKQEHSKKEWLGYETSTVENLGAGVSEACKRDSDCKTVIGNVDTIVYKITDDDTKRLEASVSGHTLTFVNHTFGSTRIPYEFEEATLKACEVAPIDGGSAPAEPKTAPKAEPKPEPAKPPPPPAKDTKKASSKWDGKYAPDQMLQGVGSMVCHPVTATLVVSHGKFSFPWYADDWNGKEADRQIGHVDGVVHDDGTTFTTVTFDDPELSSSIVRIVRVKRLVDQITSVPVTFKVDDKDKLVTYEVTMKPDNCKSGWSIRAPRPRKNPNDDYDGNWGRHMSDAEYEQTPLWTQDTKYHRGTRVRIKYNNPNAVFYVCQDDECSYEPNNNDEYGWHLLGWSNRSE